MISGVDNNCANIHIGETFVPNVKGKVKCQSNIHFWCQYCVVNDEPNHKLSIHFTNYTNILSQFNNFHFNVTQIRLCNWILPDIIATPWNPLAGHQCSVICFTCGFNIYHACQICSKVQNKNHFHSGATNVILTKRVMAHAVHSIISTEH